MRCRRLFREIFNPILIATMCACLAVARPAVLFGGPCEDAAQANNDEWNEGCNDIFKAGRDAFNTAMDNANAAYNGAQLIYSASNQSCGDTLTAALYDILEWQIGAELEIAAEEAACILLWAASVVGTAYCIAATGASLIALGISLASQLNDAYTIYAACEAPLQPALDAAGVVYNAACDEAQDIISAAAKAAGDCWDAGQAQLNIELNDCPPDQDPGDDPPGGDGGGDGGDAGDGG